MSGNIIHRGFNALSPIVDLLIRITLAHVFFISGLHKWNHWDQTVELFKQDYSIFSFLTPQSIALIGTGAEMLFGILILLGLLSRLSALVLLVINFFTTIYYPPLQAELDHAHLLLHCYWSVFLLVILCHGPGVISLDALFCRNKK